MHQRNPYHDGLDFEELAKSYDALKPYLISESNCTRKSIDFKDMNAQRRLTEAIMFRDFGVKLHIPPDRLCPPVPNRLNYILWIQDIIRAYDDVLGHHNAPIQGIDIGTGATAIYAFLACAMDSTWSMVATEIDDFSYEVAQHNIQDNNMLSRIDLRKALPHGRILFPLEREGDSYHFTLCNPPFYSSAAEVTSLAQEKALPPNAVCTGASVEMIYEPQTSNESGEAVEEGGEAGFVARMVEESVLFGTRCRWYTSMLGKMSSVLSIVAALRKRNITNYALTEFVQGQTRRWAVGWSFTDSRLPDSMARISPFIGPSHVLYTVLPPRNTLSSPLQIQGDTAFQGDDFEERVVKVLQEMLDGIDDAQFARKHPSTTSDPASLALPPNVEPSHPSLFSSSSTPFTYAPAHTSVSSRPPSRSTVALFFVEAMRNTWSRAARRKAKERAPTHAQTGHDPTVRNGTASARSSYPPSTSAIGEKPGEENASGPALTCSVRVVRARVDAAVPAATSDQSRELLHELELEFQWIFGKDRALFEGFASHVGRKVTVALAAS